MADCRVTVAASSLARPRRIGAGTRLLILARRLPSVHSLVEAAVGGPAAGISRAGRLILVKEQCGCHTIATSRRWHAPNRITIERPRPLLESPPALVRALHSAFHKERHSFVMLTLGTRILSFVRRGPAGTALCPLRCPALRPR